MSGNTASVVLMWAPMAIASASMTVTKSKICQALRTAIKARSVWAGKLVSCPYCFSHWLALGFALAMPELRWGCVLWTFVMVTLASPWMAIIRWGVGGAAAQE